MHEAMNALGTANILRGLTLEQQRTLLDLFTRSAGDMLDDWFESDLVKALFGFDAIVGNYASPYAAGSAYVMLHHAFGEVNGKKGVWGHAIGGMGAITQAMASAARAHGAEIETDAGVREVIVERDRAVGVILDDGETIRAKYVVSNVNPKLLYTRLMPADALPTPFLDRIKTWRNGSGTFRINVALTALPSFTALPGDGDHLSAGIIIGPSLGYMDRAWLDARQHGWSREPVVEILIPSTLDDSLSPPGQHVASLFCQHVAPQLPDGASWDAHRDEVADLMIATVDKLRAGLCRQRDRPPDPVAARPGTPVRPARRRHLSRRADAEPAVLGAPDAGPRRLPRAAKGPLSLRLRRPSRRRRHRRAGAQCGAGDPWGSSGAVWMSGSCGQRGGETVDKLRSPRTNWIASRSSQ